MPVLLWMTCLKGMSVVVDAYANNTVAKKVKFFHAGLCTKLGEALKIPASPTNTRGMRSRLSLEVCQGCNLEGAEYLPELRELSIFPLKVSRVSILPLSIPPTSLLPYFCAAWHNTIRHLEVLRVVYSSSNSSFFWFFLRTVLINAYGPSSPPPVLCTERTQYCHYSAMLWSPME